jgi:hypothetical protein
VPVYHGVTRGLLRIRNWEQDATAPRRWGFVADPITSGKLFDEVAGPQ